MATLESITRGAAVRGILPDSLVTISDVRWIGTVAIEVTYKDAAGRLGNELLYRDREPTLEVVEAGRPWSFDSNGGLFRLLSEANRIRLAYLFDPLLAVYTSLIEPLPRQITAVYGEMLTRQPLRFLLADDPGAGKTIMTGLLIKELIARGDLQRCLIMCPGHSLLDATLDLLIERHRNLLKRCAVLIDDTDSGEQPRTLLYLEHVIQDARTDRAGNRVVMSKRLQFVEIDGDGSAVNAGPAPDLGYCPPTDEEAKALAGMPIPVWIRGDLESQAMEYAAIHMVPQHLDEVRRRKEELLDKTKAAVQDQLTKEINYWDQGAAQLKDQELAGKVNAKLNSGLARQRADELTARMQRRLTEIEQERKLSALPSIVLGGALVVPIGLVRILKGESSDNPPEFAVEIEHSERLAMQAMMEIERRLGFIPRDVSEQNLGYDIESAIPDTGLLRFIEVKGRAKGAKTVTVTKNEILAALNKPDEFIPALGIIEDGRADVRYVHKPFEKEPDFNATSVNYDLTALLARAEAPA